MNDQPPTPRRLNILLLGVVREQIAMALVWRRRARQERALGNAAQANQCLIRYHAWQMAAHIAAQPLRTNPR